MLSKVMSPVELALVLYQLNPKAPEANSARYEHIWLALHEGSKFFCPFLGVNLIKRTRGFELEGIL